MPAIFNNKITITFNEDLLVGGQIIIALERNLNGVEQGVLLQETWVPVRSAPKKVTTGTPTFYPGERSAINYVEAFNLDYNSTNYYTVTRDLNVVTILGPNTTNNTANFMSAGATIDGSNPADVTFEFSTQDTTIFDFGAVTFTPSEENPCTKVNINVNTTYQADQITHPFHSSVMTNPVVFEVQRGSNVFVRLVDSNLLAIGLTFQTPSLLSSGNFILNIVNTPNNGGTLTITTQNLLFVSPQYSLDNINWTTINTFSSLANGQYTLYIRDQYGCSIQKVFFVGDVTVGTRVPFVYISKAMSFRFAERIVWGISDNYKNDENTLSCEVNVKLPYKETQQFQTSDIITTQLKSSYSDNKAYVVKEDGSEELLPVAQLTNNLNVKDKRDAIMVELENGFTGIYFQSGNTYDFDSGIENGTYTLNGALPYWAQSGNYIIIDSSWYIIDSVYYDETFNAEMIMLQSTYSGAPQSVIVGSIFNLFDYEVYEFEVDLSAYENQVIQIKVICSDNAFDTKTYLSEKISVLVEQDGTVEIKYRNPENTDVMYSTGIINLIRQPIQKVNGRIDQQYDTYKTDINTKLLSAELYESDEFVFEPVTKELMRKIAIALSHKEVAINGVGYVKNGDLEIEGPLEETNLYVIKANMSKIDNSFTTQNYSGTIPSTSDVPGLISNDDGFIAYD